MNRQKLPLETEMEQYFEAFLSLLEPCRPYWQSFKFIQITAEQGPRWLNLGTRIELCSSPVGKSDEILISPVPTFVASITEHPIEELDRLLSDAVHDNTLHLGSVPGPKCVHLIPAEGDPILAHSPRPHFRWDPPKEHARSMASSLFHIDRYLISFVGQTNGPRIYNCFPIERELEVDSMLQLHDPAFDGLNHLFSNLFGRRFDRTIEPLVEVLAPLPFRLERHDGIVKIQTSDNIRVEDVKCIFWQYPQRERRILTLDNGQDVHSPGTFDLPISWQPGATHGRVVLFWREKEVADVELQRWPGVADLQAKLGTFFDEGFSRLAQMLLRPSGKGGEEFEIAVSRLLSLLGLPVTWFGKNADDRRPDLAGVVHIAGSKMPVCLLVECTRERPIAKFSALRERARELREFLDMEVDVVPIVATSAAPVPSDFESAAEHGVSLIGRDELSELMALLKSDHSTQDVLRQIQSSKLHLPNIPLANWY